MRLPRAERTHADEATQWARAERQVRDEAEARTDLERRLRDEAEARLTRLEARLREPGGPSE